MNVSWTRYCDFHFYIQMFSLNKCVCEFLKVESWPLIKTRKKSTPLYFEKDELLINNDVSLTNNLMKHEETIVLYDM